MDYLYHFSEEAGIRVFEPRIAPSSAIQNEAFVWAVDAEHAHLYYFPRDCPRVCFAAGPATSADDAKRFLGFTYARHVAAIEASWLSRMRSTKLYRYVLPSEGFELIDADAGYWVSEAPVVPTGVEPVHDLLGALADAGVEVRIMPSLWPLRDAVTASTLQFSVIRWRNASPSPSD